MVRDHQHHSEHHSEHHRTSEQRHPHSHLEEISRACHSDNRKFWEQRHEQALEQEIFMLKNGLLPPLDFFNQGQDQPRQQPPEEHHKDGGFFGKLLGGLKDVVETGAGIAINVATHGLLG